MESLVTFEMYITSHLPEVMGVAVSFKEKHTLLSLYFSVSLCFFLLRVIAH